MTILPTITSPQDVKRLSPADLEALAAEVRAFIIDSVTQTGGHLGAGLGVVELTLALVCEYDFNQRDKLVWDVGHQCYPYKILTGRRHRFATLRQSGGLSGFPDPQESPYDTVKTGHGGTSISTALGYATAWKSAGDTGRKAVAVIGDGSLQEGSAYEALNFGGSFKDLGLVVVLNDNSMSISPSVGSMSGYLSRIRSSPRVNRRLRQVQTALRRIPIIGNEVEEVMQRWYHTLQGILPQHGLGIIFEELGFFYYGPIDGHDLEATRRAFRDTRWMSRPVLIHVVTTKGKGYRDDVPDITCYHAASPGKVVTARLGKEYPQQGGDTFTTAFGRTAIAMAEQDPRLVVITPAMIEGSGLVEFQRRFPERCFDVGMAEQNAVGFAAGLALAGEHPICAIYSTFLQRAYDQAFQEVALQRAKVLFCLDRGGLVGADGATHNGVFDVALLRCLPGFAVLAPRDTVELAQMMAMGFSWSGPVAIRYPRGKGPACDAREEREGFDFGESELLADGGDGAILAFGVMAGAALEVRRRVEEEHALRLAVVNARFAKPLDEKRIVAELRRQPVVFTLEDHVLAGGFGAAVAEFALARGDADASKLVPMALPDRFIDHADRTEQLAEAALDVESVVRRVAERLGRGAPRRRVRVLRS